MVGLKIDRVLGLVVRGHSWSQEISLEWVSESKCCVVGGV